MHLKQLEKYIVLSLVRRENHFHFFQEMTHTMAKLESIKQQLKFQSFKYSPPPTKE